MSIASEKKMAQKLAITAAAIAQSRNCSDIVAFDLNGKSPATDFFVIATGTSGRQIKTVADEIAIEAKKMGFQLFGMAGYEDAKWVLLDFVNVVVHLFNDEYREYYDLEMLWGDATKLDLEGLDKNEADD